MILAYRQWSNRVPLAYKVTPAIIFIWFLFVGHRLILYSASSGTCRAQPGIYEKYDSYFEVIMSGLCPPILIITLGCFLLRNVRQLAERRILPTVVGSDTNNGEQSYIQQIDSQLTIMLLLQSAIAIPSFLPYGVQNFYSSITQNLYKSPLRLAWENVIIELIRLLSYVFYSTSFYISLFSSRGFRRQVLHSLRIKKFTRVQPVNTQAQLKPTNTIRKTEPSQV